MTGESSAPLRGPRIVALGDSVTLGVGDRPVPGIGAGWAAHAAYVLGASEYVNLAANGVRARDLMRTQVPSALMHQPDVVLFTAGGNDVMRGDFDPDEVCAHLRDAIERLSRPGRVLVTVGLDRIGLFALLGRHVDTVMARRIGQANAAIAAAVAGTDTILIDGASEFASLGPAAWHIDRIHPSPTGHRALAVAAARATGLPAVREVTAPGRAPSLPAKAAWLAVRGLPWIAKRSRDLIPQAARVVTHELLEERRERRRLALGA